jgi:AcrR family transcriptional regulator
VGATGRPLRRDAERNRQRILEAALEVFADRGLAGTLDDVAAAAGVGVGTVYRRFPNKDDLVEALFEARIGQVADIARDAAELADPWEAFETFLTRAAEVMAFDRGMKEVLLGSGGRERVERGRAQIQPIVGGIIKRAQEAGVLRGDIVPLDMPLIQLMLSTIADASRDVRPDLWRRYLELILDGLRAEPGREMPPPPQPAEMAATMNAWRPSPRRGS